MPNPNHEILANQLAMMEMLTVLANNMGLANLGGHSLAEYRKANESLRVRRAATEEILGSLQSEIGV